MCIENESTGKYICSHAPYTRFTSVVFLKIFLYFTEHAVTIYRYIAKHEEFI